MSDDAPSESFLVDMLIFLLCLMGIIMAHRHKADSDD